MRVSKMLGKGKNSNNAIDNLKPVLKVRECEDYNNKRMGTRYIIFTAI